MSTDNNDSIERQLWDNVQKALNESDDKLNSRIFTLATGGLGLSFTVFSFVVSEMKISLTWPALAIWLAFLICIILDSSSLACAKVLTSRLEKKIRKKIKNEEPISDVEANAAIDTVNKVVSGIEWFAFILSILAIVGAALYCYFLFK